MHPLPPLRRAVDIEIIRKLAVPAIYTTNIDVCATGPDIVFIRNNIVDTLNEVGLYRFFDRGTRVYAPRVINGELVPFQTLLLHVRSGNVIGNFVNGIRFSRRFIVPTYIAPITRKRAQALTVFRERKLITKRDPRKCATAAITEHIIHLRRTRGIETRQIERLQRIATAEHIREIRYTRCVKRRNIQRFQGRTTLEHSAQRGTYGMRGVKIRKIEAFEGGAATKHGIETSDVLRIERREVHRFQALATPKHITHAANF